MRDYLQDNFLDSKFGDKCYSLIYGKAVIIYNAKTACPMANNERPIEAIAEENKRKFFFRYDGRQEHWHERPTVFYKEPKISHHPLAADER